MAVKQRCNCPRDVTRQRQVHRAACPNRKRGKNRGPSPKWYTDRVQQPRTFSHARAAVERLRLDLHRIYGGVGCGDDVRELIVSARLQAETIRRYLDGE